MVEVRYLSRNSVLRTISLKELGESGYSPRTFNHAGLPQVVLITYLHFYQVSQPQLLVLFLIHFIVASIMVVCHHRVSFARNRFVARTGVLSTHPTRYTGLHARNSPIFITTIFVQIPYY